MARTKKKKAKRVVNHQWVYIMSNASMPGLLKIGMTTTSPQQRNRELGSATGVPTPFKLEYSLEVSNAVYVERAIHTALRDHRVNHRREFFEVDLKTAIRAIKSVSKRRRRVLSLPLRLLAYALEAFSALMLIYWGLTIWAPDLPKMLFW